MKEGSLIELIPEKSNHDSLITLEEMGNVIPIPNTIYVLRNLGSAGEGVTALRVEEIVNPPMNYRDGFGECMFHIFLFRELQAPEEVSMEIFLLQPEIAELMEELSHERG